MLRLERHISRRTRSFSGEQTHQRASAQNPKQADNKASGPDTFDTKIAKQQERAHDCEKWTVEFADSFRFDIIFLKVTSGARLPVAGLHSSNDIRVIQQQAVVRIQPANFTRIWKLVSIPDFAVGLSRK